MSHSRELIGYATFILALSSLAFLAIYVHLVYLFKSQVLPELLFWIFALALSVTTMLLWAFGGKKIGLVAVFASAFVLVSMFFFRFYFYGWDLVGEYSVAKITHELGRWTPEMVTARQIWLNWRFCKPDEFQHRYFSTTSVTILPAIMSEVTGASLRLVFWFLLSVVSTTAVILGFLIVRTCFGQKVATLSSIVFVFSSFYMGKFATILREDVALLFLLLAVFCILKEGRKNLVISLISLASLPMSHYGLVYFAILSLLLLLVSKKLQKNKILRKINPNLSSEFSRCSAISGPLVLYLTITVIFWFMFVAYPIFLDNIEGFVEFFDALLGPAPTRLSYFQQHIFLSSLGPFNTAVQWLERVMAGMGFVLALKTCKSRKAFSFAFLGGGLLAAALALAFLPTLSLLFDLDRTMQVALVGFSAFIAVAVFRIFQKNNFGKVLSIFFVTLILLETLHSPILYSSASNLSREDYIFSFTHVVTFYESSDFQFAEWAESFTNKSDVFASDNRGWRLCLITKRICAEPRGADVPDTVSLLESGKTDYFVFLSYLRDYMSFRSENGDELQLNSTDISKLLDSNRLNRIYDDSRITNFGYV